ncbi:hypothetical protein Tco_0622359 [Tanacetum coccineum]
MDLTINTKAGSSTGSSSLNSQHFLGLQVKEREDGIFISQDKYVAEILKKFCFTDVRTASTLLDTEKPLLKDSDGDDVDVHLYRSDIMFAVCACARFLGLQVKEREDWIIDVSYII